MQTEVISQRVNLEADELFTQLRFLASLVEIGPRRGFFMSIQNIVEKKTTRIFRTWLAERAKKRSDTETSYSEASLSSKPRRGRFNTLDGPEQGRWVESAGTGARMEEQHAYPASQG